MAGGGGRDTLVNTLVNSYFLFFTHVNLNCLTNKIAFVQDLVVDFKIDLLGISETWLTSEINDATIDIAGYNLIRNDSPTGIRKHGVAAYIKSDMKYTLIPMISANTIGLHLIDFNVYCAVVYRPPSYTAHENSLLIQSLTEFARDREVCVLGDFNLPSINWKENCPTGYILPTDRQFLEFFAEAGLEQVVRDPTNFPSGSTIDLCLVSDEDRIGECEVLPPFPNCSHGIIKISYTFQQERSNLGMPSLAQIKKKLWSHANFKGMRSRLRGVDWREEFFTLGVEQQYRRFLEITDALTSAFVPLKDAGPTQKPPWALNPPRSMRRARGAAWQEYKTSKTRNGRHHPDTAAAWLDFNDANEELRHFAINSQKAYEKKVAAQLDSKPKLFHSYIRYRKVGKPSIGPIRLLSGHLSDSPQQMASCFVESFSGVFATTDPTNPLPHQACDSNFGRIRFTPQDVKEVLELLDVNTSTGHDEIHPRFLKVLAHELSVPLAIMFNQSIDEGRLPSEWLSSIVVPIFKKGERCNPLNYRPVSLTSVVCKAMERLIMRPINEYLSTNSLINANQFGFRSGHSTADQLLLTYNNISIFTDSGKTVDLVFFDFMKAFDKVIHNIVLDKLTFIGVSPELVGWIKCFLVERIMQVRISGVTSSSVPVTSGVPQGSVLGPLLFLIYVNHVVSQLTSEYMIFADDVKLYLAHESDQLASQASLQNDIDTLVETSASWGLHMNASKCVCIRFSSVSSNSVGQSPYNIGGNSINFVDSHSDLGVVIDKSQKYHNHIRKLARVCNGITTNMLASTLCREPEFLMNVYLSHVRPKLDYCSCLWNQGYVGDTRMLERVQRRWTREVRGLEDLPYSQRLKQLDLFSFQGRMLRSDMIMVWRIFHRKSAATPEVLFTMTDSSRRGHNLRIFLPRFNTDLRKRSFAIRVIADWNGLSPNTVNAQSLTTFKRLLQVDLGQRLFDYLE